MSMIVAIRAAAGMVNERIEQVRDPTLHVTWALISFDIIEYIAGNVQIFQR